MKVLYSILLLISTPFFSPSQVVLNEFCSINRSLLTDFNGERTDWLELYNAGLTSVDITGFALSDDPQQPQQWVFQGGVIAPLSFMIVLISGKDLQIPEFHTNFKLSSSGEQISLRDALGNLVDQLLVPSLHADDSWGRKPDGNALTSYFDVPTPGASNNLSLAYTGYLPDVSITPSSGFSSSPPVISMSCSATNYEIRYTRNGSEPSPGSSLFTTAFPIFVNTAFKANAFSTNGTYLPSSTACKTYMINVDTKLPVVTLITDSLNLFSWDSGLFVTGPNASPTYPFYGANYWMEKEYPANIEYYDENKDLRFAQDLGIQINGGSVSRTRPQKALRLIARDLYGDPDIDERFFPLKNISSFNNIVMRNASGDWSKVHFRDAYVHQLLLEGKINVDVLAYRPVATFINGTYWGIYNLRERVSKYYLEENYGIDRNNVDILEEDTLIVDGDFAQFNSMHTFMTTNSMSISANYDSAAAMIDLPGLCDYFITETYFSNIDWPYNNIKYWKVRSAGNKWRYILLDLDITLGNYNWAPYTMDVLGRLMGPYGYNNRHVQILKSLLANTGFRHYFINRYADLVNTLYSTPSLLSHLSKLRSDISTDMLYHMPRWGFTYTDWENEIDNVAVPYIVNRPEYAMDQVRDTFNLTKKVLLTLNVWPQGAGEIKINTIQPGPLPWTGTYFDGVPVTVTVLPGPDHKFEFWRSEKIMTQNNYNSVIYFNPDTSDVFTAYLSPLNNTGEIVLFPNPVSEFPRAGFQADKEETAYAEIMDGLGHVVYISGKINCTDGFNLVELSTINLSEGLYFLKIRTERKEMITRFIKINPEL